MARKTVAKKTAKKPPKKAVKKTRRRTAGREDSSLMQGIDPNRPIGPGNPPADFLWKPGQSGNPAGPTPRTNLWRHFARYANMSREQLAALKRKKGLTIAQICAIRCCELLPKLGRGAARDLVQESFNRDEGRPTFNFHMQSNESLSHEECEQIRKVMRRQLERP